MSKNKDLLQVRLTKDISMEEVDRTAKELSLSRSKLAEEGLKLLTQWEPDFYKAVLQWSEKLQVKPSTFIENIILDWLARLSGELEVFGPTQQVMPEFVHQDGELLKGKKFYEKRRRDYAHHFQRELDKRDAERAEQAKKEL